MESKIVIAKPCHQNWNKMTAEQQGRHCAVCSKVVKDFTKMKTEEIVNSLKSTDGEVCGRINVKQLTPANKKQQVYFWINGMLFRKAIYPIMALLGVTFLSKKAGAQTNDYPLKGRVAYNNYHTSSKKITIVVKTNNDNSIVHDAHITILSGIKNHPEELITDANGRVALNIDAEDLIGDMVEIGITAPGYEYKQSKIKIIKDIQTIEIKMEEEMMIMGEMMMIPEEIDPEIKKVIERDTVEKIQITKCSILIVQNLPEIKDSIVGISWSEQTIPAVPDQQVEANSLTETIIDQEIYKSAFNVFPVPSFDHVNIVSGNDENFNVDIFDGNGKKIHTGLNSNSRYTLDVSNYAAGIYYVLLSASGKAVETKKIVVSR